MPTSSPDSGSNDEVVRLLIDLIRDQGRVLNAIAENAAVGADRQQRVADVTSKMADVLLRLDGYLAREEAANAAARANVLAGAVEQRAALTKLFNLVLKGLGSSTGQRVIQTLVLAWLGWASVHYGFVLPAASAPAAAPAPIP